MKTTVHFLMVMVFKCLAPALVNAQWAPKVKISPNSVAATMNENMASCLAVSNDTVHVVWCDRHAAGSAVYYRRSADTGLTWNTAKPITDTMGSASFPAIAVSGATVHVVWMDTSLHRKASFYKRSLDGGNTWGATYVLDSDTKFWPGLAASGPLVVVSLNKEIISGNTEVYFRRSLNNGTTWDTLQRISNANGRSEDPAIAALGKNVYLSWNDNRNSANMQTYYRHSANSGLTWGPETQLVVAAGGAPNNCYTTMVSVNGPYVDVPCGESIGGEFDVHMKQSPDTGNTFGTDKQLTSTPSPVNEAYPYLVRDSMNLHMVYLQFNTGPTYLHSANGGVTWDTAVNLGHGGQPFIAYTCSILHAIWTDSGAVYYRRNPTGNASGHANCNVVRTGIAQPFYSNSIFSVYPNPVVNNVTIAFNKEGMYRIALYDITGRTVNEFKSSGKEFSFSTTTLSSGIYFLKVAGADGMQMEKLVKE
ncbi:MAG: T9SS type A sorting domain-containing protein [Taibaiella sp.]|nr:T9SS type A sorting domain-containing protein [Taibaiella sp.]